MKSFLLLALLVSTSAFAQNLSRINADFRCEQAGGGIAVKVGASVSTARAWQTDLGDLNGLEIKLTDFKLARCPGCFSFEGLLVNTVPVKATVRNFLLNYEVQDETTGKWVTVLSNVRCVPTQK